MAVPAMRGSKARARACEEAVLGIPGVRYAHANELTGNLLVLYTPSSLTRETVQQRCAAWAGKYALPPCGPGHGHRRGHAAGGGLVIELVRHLLPLAFGSCPRCGPR